MSNSFILHLTVIAVLITGTASQTTPATTTYKNHTVGDKSGWFFNSSTNTSATNYSAWASSDKFNLGDFLIFNTISNQTVIQTYNLTTYDSCSIDDASDSDPFQYNGGITTFNEALTITVPLTIEGPNYFFSGANDGVQCEHGMAFEIYVNRGLGLPPSLNRPPPPPYQEPPGSDSAQSPPVTVASESDTSGNGGSRVRDGPRVGITCAVALFALVWKYNWYFWSS